MYLPRNLFVLRRIHREDVAWYIKDSQSDIFQLCLWATEKTCSFTTILWMYIMNIEYLQQYVPLQTLLWWVSLHIVFYTVFTWKTENSTLHIWNVWSKVLIAINWWQGHCAGGQPASTQRPCRPVDCSNQGRAAEVPRKSPCADIAWSGRLQAVIQSSHRLSSNPLHSLPCFVK